MKIQIKYFAKYLYVSMIGRKIGRSIWPIFWVMAGLK